MSVSNLTNTSWVFKTSGLSLSSNLYFQIDFTSGPNTWDHIAVDSNDLYYISDYNKYSEIVYPVENEYATTWGSASDKTITITGGDDVTNSTLISWLESNAHQITVTNLTNTTWEINDNFNIFKNQDGNFYINYNFGGIGYGSPHVEAVMTQLSLSGVGPTENPYYFMPTIDGTCSAMNGQTDITPSDYASTVNGYIIDPSTGEYETNTVYIFSDYNAPWDYGWTLSGRTITILGGTDVTNAALINWLTDNATLSQQALATVEYDGETLTSIPANTTVTFNTAGKLLTSSITVTTGSGGTTPTLISKSITVNGTYNAYSDSADGYSQVTVAVPGPSYTTTSRATASQVLSGYYFYYPNSSSAVTRTAGTMTNRGAVSQTLTASSPSYTIPAGYHNGSGVVSVAVYDGSVVGAGLAGTTWLLNSTPTAGGLSDGSNSFDVNYTFDGLSINSVTPTLTTFDISLDHYGPNSEYLYVTLSGTCAALEGAYESDVLPSEFPSRTSFGWDPYYSDTAYFYTNNDDAPFSGWTFNNRTISFIDGDDINNSDLITWLEANAVQQ